MEEEDEIGWDSGVILPVQGSTNEQAIQDPSLHALPESILLAILSCLSAKDLAAIACTDRWGLSEVGLSWSCLVQRQLLHGIHPSTSWCWRTLAQVITDSSYQRYIDSGNALARFFH